MKKIEVKVRYLFEGTYTVAADDRNEARTMVTRDCGLVLGGNQVTDNSMTVIAHEKEANFEATCHTPFELGASNIDWLQQMYDAVWQLLEENRDNNA